VNSENSRSPWGRGWKKLESFFLPLASVQDGAAVEIVESRFLFLIADSPFFTFFFYVLDLLAYLVPRPYSPPPWRSSSLSFLSWEANAAGPTGTASPSHPLYSACQAPFPRSPEGSRSIFAFLFPHLTADQECLALSGSPFFSRHFFLFHRPRCARSVRTSGSLGFARVSCSRWCAFGAFFLFLAFSCSLPPSAA